MRQTVASVSLGERTYQQLCSFVHMTRSLCLNICVDGKSLIVLDLWSRLMPLALEARRRVEHTALNIIANSREADIGGLALTPSEAGRLLAICIELIDLCAKVTSRIDPAVGSLVENTRDEAMAEVIEIGV